MCANLNECFTDTRKLISFSFHLHSGSYFIRLVYLEHIQSRLEREDGGKLETGGYELQLHLMQAEAANAQGCFKVALSKMKEARKVRGRSIY